MFKITKATISRQKELLYGMLCLGGITTLMTLYAAHLNQTYYLHYGPFFDSSLYLNNLFAVIRATHSSGILEGLRQAMEIGGVTGLPLFQTVLLGLFVDQPTRQLAASLHFPWLLLFATSLFIYFLIFRQKGLLWSLASTLPFMSIAALWRQNGGLSDFRLDLLLYLLLSTAFTWFLTTKRSLSYWPWAIMGLFAGLTFLTRATSPVYAIVCIIPIVLGRLILDPATQRKTNLLGTLLAALIATLISLWFYIAKFDFLHYYYVLWNIDANANLPLSESKMHIKLAFWNTGRYALIAAAMIFLLTMLKTFSIRKRSELNAVQRQLNWEALWLGIAPVALLVVKGAGLNPFVAMPAAFGILMFLIDPVFEISSHETPNSRPLAPFVLGISAFMMVTAALQGIEYHTQPVLFPRLYKAAPMYPNMASQKQLIELALTDIETTGKEEISNLDVIYISGSGLSNSFLESILKFDFQASSMPHHQGDRLQISKLFLIAAPVDWEKVVGNTDAEKAQTLANQATQDLDYLILPEDEAIPLIVKQGPYALINYHTAEIKTKVLATGKWQSISTPIQVDFGETVRLYKKVVS